MNVAFGSDPARSLGGANGCYVSSTALRVITGFGRSWPVAADRGDNFSNS
jgi:hypothetical protein